MTLSRALLLVVPLLTLTGCFDLLEDIWINADGSGRVRIDLGVSTTLFSFGGARMKEELEREFHADAERARKAAEEVGGVKKITVESREENGVFHVVYDLEVTDVTRLPEIQKKLLDGSDRVKQSRRETPIDVNFRIEETSQGYRFVQGLGSGRSRADAGSAEKGAAELFAQGMLGAMFADRGLTVRLHAPEFATHNGTLSADKKTVEWKVPFSKLLVPGGTDQELTAEIVTGKETIFYIAGGALALLLVLGGVSLGRRKKRPVRMY